MPDPDEYDDKGKGGGGGGKKKPPRGRKPTLGNPDADPVRIHREYVERRTGGGAPPTEEAFARAVEQWHRLPGAVNKPATELRGERGERPLDEEGEERPEEPGPDAEQGS